MTPETNELLTRIGPNSRMGQLMRRYWHPIAGASELKDKCTLPVRILGEDLILFKDKAGVIGLIELSCAHRHASLEFGIPIDGGIRCPYHGWAYNHTGHCTDRPGAATPAHFKDKPLLKAYPVKELAGLLFAYLGPPPAPELPRFEGLVKDGMIRQIGKAIIPCNWLQIMENSVDTVHVEWLHGAAFEFYEGLGRKLHLGRKHVKVACDEFEFGIIKRRLLEGQTEDCEDWKVGHPLVFPNQLMLGSAGGLYEQHSFQYRVPVDDTNTLHIWYNAYLPPRGVEVKTQLLDETPTYDVPFVDAKGKFMFEYIHAQDIMAWVTQGPIADRSTEMLTATDVGIATLRKMLLRELEKVERGDDPIGVLRNPARNTIIHLPLEHDKGTLNDGFREIYMRHVSNFSPIRDDILEVFANSATGRPILAATA